VEQIIEVRYAGVVIGRAPSVAGADAHGLFLGLADPMPVGTKLSVRVGEDAVDGRVEQVLESGDPAKAGMRVRFDDPSALSLFGVAGAPPRTSGTRPSATDEVAPVAPVASVAASSPVGEDDAGAAGAAQDAAADDDRSTAPESSNSADNHGGQPGGGGRRRRRRR
jgi:hypothetical protein